MVDKALLPYIKKYLQQGYSINAIRAHLIKYYPNRIVDEAINSVYKPEVKHVIHFSTTTLIAIVVIALGLIITGIFLSRPLQKPLTPTKLLDLKTSLLTTAVKAGQNLEFNIELINLGTIKGFDVYLIYNIYDSQDNLLTSKEETIALVTKASTKTTINIPSNAEEGTYQLSVIARYNGKQATAKDSFSIYSKKLVETCFDGIQNRDEEGIDCGGTYCDSCEIEATCEDGIQNQDETGIDCGGPCLPCRFEPEPTCSDRIKNQGEEKIDCGGPCKPCPDLGPYPDLTLPEKIKKIKEIAKTDKNEALRLCSGFILENYREECIYNVAVVTADSSICSDIEGNRTRDKCYSKTAEVTNNSEICDNIEKESRKDSCYMHFVMEGDYSMCDKISNKYLKQSCESLREIQG